MGTGMFRSEFCVCFDLIVIGDLEKKRIDEGEGSLVILGFRLGCLGRKGEEGVAFMAEVVEDMAGEVSESGRRRRGERREDFGELVDRGREQVESLNQTRGGDEIEERRQSPLSYAREKGKKTRLRRNCTLLLLFPGPWEM